MHSGLMVTASKLPNGPLPGMHPDLPVISSFELAGVLGLTLAGMDRLVRRHRKELRAYGPLFEGPNRVSIGSDQPYAEYYLTSDQRALLTLLSETKAGAAQRATLLLGPRLQPSTPVHHPST